MIGYQLLYLLLWLASVLFFVLYQGVFSLELLVVCTLFPLLLLLLLLWQKMTLTIQGQASVNQTRCGETFQIQLHMCSRCPIPVRYAVVHLCYMHSITGETDFLDMHVPILGCNAQVIRLPFRISCCGKFTVEVTSVRLYAPLSLFSCKISCRENVSVLILPECDRFHALPAMPLPVPTEQGERFSDTKAGDDPSEIFALKPYQQGDACSRIHWKLTAKIDELMIKHFSLPLQEDIVLLPDYRLGGNTRRDAMLLHDVLSVCYSFSLQLHHSGYSHDALWYPIIRGERPPFELHTTEDTTAMMCSLLKTVPLPQAEAAIFGLEEPPGARMIYCTAIMDAETVDCLSQLARRCRLLVLLVSDTDKPPIPEDAAFECMTIVAPLHKAEDDRNVQKEVRDS